MAFLSNSCTLRIGGRRVTTSGKVCRLVMKAKGKSNKPSRSASQDSNIPKKGDDNSKSSTPENMLLADLKQMRSKRTQAKGNSSSVSDERDSSGISIKSIIETILLWDFFLVLAFLSWLVVALIPHFVSKNDVLLDPWLALWQPFIQPVLGVLMLGTIVQGTISYISSDK